MVIKPQYVEEAARLLRTSIIQVDSDDLSIQSFEGKNNNMEIENIVQDKNTEDNSTPGDKKVNESQYKEIANRIVKYLSNQESYMSVKELANWYLEEYPNEEGDSELETNYKLIVDIIINLVEKDGQLIRINRQQSGESMLLSVK